MPFKKHKKPQIHTNNYNERYKTSPLYLQKLPREIKDYLSKWGEVYYIHGLEEIQRCQEKNGGNQNVH